MSEARDKIAELKKRVAALRGFAARNREEFTLHGIEFYRCLSEGQDKTAADLEDEAARMETENERE